MEAKWLILGVLIPSALFLFGFAIWIIIKLPRGMAKLAEDAGWKRMGFGIYLSGQWGGPYEEPEADDNLKPATCAHPVRRALLLVAIVFGSELLAVVGGAAIAHALGRSELAGAIVGVLGIGLLIGATWLVRGGIALRAEIARRQSRH